MTFKPGDIVWIDLDQALAEVNLREPAYDGYLCTYLTGVAEGRRLSINAEYMELAFEETPQDRVTSILSKYETVINLNPKLCTCDLYTQILPYGCKCGGQ